MIGDDNKGPNCGRVTPYDESLWSFRVRVMTGCLTPLPGLSSTQPTESQLNGLGMNRYRGKNQLEIVSIQWAIFHIGPSELVLVSGN